MRVRVHGVAVDTCIDESGVKRVAEHAAYFDEGALKMQLVSKTEGVGREASGREAIRARAVAHAARRAEALMKRTRVKLYLSVHGGRVHSVEGAETYSVGMVTLGMGSPLSS